MALSDIVNVQISTTAVNITRAGFGVPLTLAADAPGGFVERVRFYTDLTGLAVDFPSGATYGSASAIFAQTPRPPMIAVGRCVNKPTQKFNLIPSASNSTVYQVKVNGLLASFTSDATATVAEITAGLKTAIDALVQPVTTTDNSTSLDVTATAAGAFFSLEVLNNALIKVTQSHVDPGLAADLAAIALENSSWYALLYAFGSKVCVDAISQYAEANGKMYFASTNDSDTVNLSFASDTAGSQTIAGLLNAGVRFRTALIYHPSNGAHAASAWAGRVLPLDPGSETWAFKQLAGVASYSLTATQRVNASAKKMNFMESLAGVSMTQGGADGGKVSGNEYIDVIRFRDWLTARLQESVVTALAANSKIPYTDAGIAVVEGVVRGVLAQGVAAGGIINPHVSVPLLANVSTADKASRTLKNVLFDAQLAGAVQAVNISGQITV